MSEPEILRVQSNKLYLIRLHQRPDNSESNYFDGLNRLYLSGLISAGQLPVQINSAML